MYGLSHIVAHDTHTPQQVGATLGPNGPTSRMFEHWTACPYLTSEERGYLAEHIAYHRIVSMRIEELLAGRNDKQV
jgi:hypothetical protein